jgi:hypothetical protein
MIFFGSLWGISELVAGEYFAGNNVPHYSAILAAWAFLVLAVARGMVNMTGSSLVIGAVATLFKAVNTAPFICHLLGIFCLGVAFDLFASLLLKREGGVWRSAVTGILSAYGGYALFGMVITYVVRYEYWVIGGFPKVIHHVFVSGSLAVVAGMILVPLGFSVGRGGLSLIVKQPRWTYPGVVLGTLFMWLIVRLA